MAEKLLIDEKEDSRFLCRYQATIVFMCGETTITMLPENIISIEKEDNFDLSFRSTIRVKLHIDTRKKLWMMKNAKDLKCKFELSYVRQDTDGLDSLKGGTTIWNSMFSVYFTETGINEDEVSMEQTMGLNEDNKNPTRDLENESFWERTIFDVYLYETKSLQCSKKVVNRVFQSSNLQNIIAELATEVGQNNIYMTRLDNQQTYSNFCVRAFPFSQALAYLDSTYGFYSCGSQIYYDVDKLYILKANGKNTAKEANEWVDTVFLVTSRNLAVPGNGMIKKPEEKVYYINITEENIIPEDPSITTATSEGSSMQVISADLGSSATVSGGTETIGTVRTTKFIRGKENRYYASTVQARMEENTNVQKISMENVDLRAFGLNKTFKIVFEEPEKQKKYGNDRYRISYASHLLRAESTQYMICTSNIALKKCSDA